MAAGDGGKFNVEQERRKTGNGSSFRPRVHLCVPTIVWAYDRPGICTRAFLVSVVVHGEDVPTLARGIRIDVTRVPAASLYARPNACLGTFLSTCLRVCLNTCLNTCLTTCLNTEICIDMRTDERDSRVAGWA